MTKIGIINLTDSWQALLNQIGVNYSPISEHDKVYTYTLIIINLEDISPYINKLESFVNKGGAILDCHGSLFRNRNFRSTNKDFLVLDNFLYNGLLDLNSQIKEIYLNEAKCWKYYTIDKSGEGLISFLGFPIDKLLSNKKSKRVKFLSDRKRHPEEEVNTISKGGILRLVFNLLKELHIKRDLPFIHKWFFPGKESNIFLFREDTDYCNEKDLIKIQEMSALNKIKITWFIHTKSNLDFLEKFKNNTYDELALHCFDHFTSRKIKLIKDDLKKGKEALMRINIIPKGYSAPYGLWSKSLSKVLNDLDFNYSSEFSFIYNSLPYKSSLTDNIIQIPIHPICIDSLLKAGKDDEEIIKYYTDEIDNSISNLLPIALYDHPGHGHYNILDSIFKYINSLEINSFTFKEYAIWWKKREESGFKVKLLPNYILDVDTEEEVSLCLWKSRSEYLLLDKKGSYNIESSNTISLPDNKSINKNELNTIRNKDINMTKRALMAKYLWRNRK